MGWSQNSATDDAVKAMMASMDRDKDGTISLVEFTSLIEKNQTEGTNSFGSSMTDSLFSSFSSSLCGGEEQVEGRTRLTGTPINILFDTLDVDSNQQISAEEFIGLMVVAGIGGENSFEVDERAARNVMRQFGVEKTGAANLSETEFEHIIGKMSEAMGTDSESLSTQFIEALTTEEEE